MLQLYENIKKRRKELGMTQTDLANKLGYSTKSIISRIEAGDVDISQSKIMAFAKALNISASELMGLDGVEAISEMQQKAFEDPQLRMLFNLASDATPEDVEMVINMLKHLKDARK